MADNSGQFPACPRHPQLEANLKCAQCNEPICRECVRENGYFCSAACRNSAQATTSPEEKAERQRQQEEERALLDKVRKAAYAVVALLAVLAAVVVWKTVIAPVGKVCWTWECPPESAVLDLHDDALLAVAGPDLVILDAGNGNERKRLARPAALSTGIQDYAKLENGYFLHDRRAFCGLDYEGKVTYAAEFQSTPGTMRIDTEQGRFAYVLNGRQIYFASEDSPRAQIIARSLANGEIIWQRELEQGQAVRDMMLSAKHVLVTGRKEAGDRGEYILCLSADSGAPQWQADLTGERKWGPQLAGSRMLVHVEGELRCLGLDGTTAWTVEAESLQFDEYAYPEHRIFRDMILLQTRRGTECRLLADGSLLWKDPMRIAGDTVTGNEQRMYLTAARADLARKATEQMTRGREDLESVMEDFTGGTDAVATMLQPPSLICLNPRTGEALWETKRVAGQILATDERLVNVMDTSTASTLQILTGGKGVTVVQQFDADNGKRLYRRQLEIGFIPAGVAGNRLVGMRYERTDVPGLMELAHGKKNDMKSMLPGRPDAVVGIRLK